MKFLNYWQPYREAVFTKMMQGYKDYGDKSFDRPLLELIKEIKQELEDVSGWACVTWGVLDELEKKVMNLEEKHDSS